MLSLLLPGHPSTREVTREVVGAWLVKNEEKPFLRVVGAWLVKNEEKPFLRVVAMLLTARQYRERLEQGRVEMRAELLAWLERRDTPLEKGEPFDEPPPSA